MANGGTGRAAANRRTRWARLATLPRAGLRQTVLWLFIYAPKRFTIPFVGLLLWWSLFVWPLFARRIFQSDQWVDEIYLGWLDRLLDRLYLREGFVAFVAVGLLLLGVFVAYNAAALLYARLLSLRRGWSIAVGGALWLGAATLIYTWPCLISPKHLHQLWATGPCPIETFELPLLGSYSTEQPCCDLDRGFFHWLVNPIQGIYWFGILWFLPLLVFFGLAAQLLYEVVTAPTSSPLEPPTSDDNPTFRSLKQHNPELRIGIILAGGGAKGAYQAGAMRALHEFLDRHDALENVEMIAGTSIGSWNALFWLAGLVAPAKKGELSEHERWWYTAGIRRIAEFSTYWIFGKNWVLTTKPWQANFDEIFGGDNLKARWRKIGIPGNGSEPLMRFYLTRSNVRTGRLAFSTNWNAGLRDTVNAGSNRINRKDGDADASLGDATEVRTTEDLKAAVFASMDLPPLFPYYEFALGNGDSSAVDFFEDGGVVDNLPVMFGTSVENCDLLFVFPLNASFEQSVERRSILGRMLRVLDVRQGVLERNSMRLAYVHNQILDLKGKKALRVFAICPNRPLRVGTGEFWKTLDFSHCFRLMYDATWAELNRFDFSVAPTGRPDDEKTWIRMAIVDDDRSVKYTGDF